MRYYLKSLSSEKRMNNIGILLCVVVCTLLLVNLMNNHLFSNEKCGTYFTECLSNGINTVQRYQMNTSGNIQYYNNVKGEPFVTHGNWKPGKRHNQTCDFIKKEKCCTKKQKNLHFEFYNEHLNKINAIEELKHILKTKKMLLIGDSLMFEFFIGLKELLRVKTTMTMTKYFCANTTCAFKSDNNVTVRFLKACMIELKGRNFFTEFIKSRLVSEKIIRKEIAKHDIIFFNQGVHYDIRTLLIESTIHFNNIGSMLHEATRHTSKQVILRATPPQHFISRSGLGFYKDRFKNGTYPCTQKVPFPVPHPTNYFLKNMATRFNFSFLDNFSIYYQRGDLAGGIVDPSQNKVDCTHHCYTPELIWPELVLLTQSIKK